MESRLKALMDFQRFYGNADLQQVINSTHSRYATQELSLDEMEWVNAAGMPDINIVKKNGDKAKDANRRS